MELVPIEQAIKQGRLIFAGRIVEELRDLDGLLRGDRAGSAGRRGNAQVLDSFQASPPA
jgi:hypothetical protein